LTFHGFTTKIPSTTSRVWQPATARTVDFGACPAGATTLRSANKMKLAITALSILALFGCASNRDGKRDQNSNHHNVISNDIEIVSGFLDALYRPGRTPYRVVPDADADEGMGHISVNERNRELSNRLNQLRRAPSAVILITLHSGDRPEPPGSEVFVYSYDTKTGDFAVVGPHKIGDSSSNMWIDVRHWPNGTRLLNVRHTWINDFKDNIFHLRRGEQTFRFAVAIEPLTD